MKDLYQIREISTLSFNERVLQEAEDPRNPLLERLKFLGIFSSNMDEFFKVRVASVQRRIELGKKQLAEVLEALGDEARELDERFQSAYAQITRALREEGIRILTERDIEAHSDGLGAWVTNYFREQILPSLVPIILARQLPFPPLTDGALYFGVKMWAKEPRYALVEIPSSLPRFVELPSGDIMYVDDVIRHSLDELFHIFRYERIEAYAFKISRDAQLDIDNDFSEGYVRKMGKVLGQRKGGRPTRLVYDATMPRGLLNLLRRQLHIDEDDTLIGGGRYHSMKDLMRFPAHRPNLVFPKREPAKHPVLDADDTAMMKVIAERDILVTYPYQSFDHVIRLLREAAIDPKVQEIKMTLYRTANNSQVVNALANAARNGKRVFVGIELQARFDEEHNIAVSDKLLEAGATVVYGFPPMKVHSKLLLIQRGRTRFAGLSTGNFNEVTGKLYVDSILLTADKRLANEVAAVLRLFTKNKALHDLTPPKLRHLVVSPFNTRRVLTKEIAREEEKGSGGYILLKINHLTDVKVIKKLRAAAVAGVQTDLVVRTTYAMPQHPNVRAISILDRYLEHQRIYVFGRGDDCRVYMSSADLMERNLDWRMEVAFPIYDPELRQQVVDMMALQVADTGKARVLDHMQTNKYVDGGGDGPCAQLETYRYLQRLYDNR